MNDTAVSQDDKTMGMLAHLSALISIGPLIIWLMNKDKPDKEFVNTEAKEALNFVISLWIVGFGAMIVSMIVGFIPVLGLVVSLIIGLACMAIGIAALVFIIIAAMKANEGVHYRYPVNLRLVK
ncbi:MAG: DUF4870 domain-containing protein [Arenimonas sp.]